MNTPDAPTAAASTSWFLSVDWAILASELAAVFFFFALIVGILAWLGRRKRLKSARALLDARSSIASTATDTFSQHVAALLPEHTLSEDELDDYQQRGHEVINALVEPWLDPSPQGLQSAVRSIMGIRHTDLHQVAAIFRAQPAAAAVEAPETKQALETMKTELISLKKAEAERSAQLAEALKSVSIIVSEYGRKFDIEGDFQAPKILRTIVYLQGIEQGLDHETAMNQADAALESGLALSAGTTKPLIFNEDEEISDASAAEIVAALSPDPAPKPPETQPAKPEPAPSDTELDTTGLDVTDDTEVFHDVPAAQAPAEPEQVQAPEDEVVFDQVQAAATGSDEAAATSEPNAPDDEISEPAEDMPVEATVTADEKEAEELEEPDINLDDIELPAEAPDEAPAAFDLDLDDIDALLDAEIARQQSSYTEQDAGATPLSDDDLDLSKKPPV